MPIAGAVLNMLRACCHSEPFSQLPGGWPSNKVPPQKQVDTSGYSHEEVATRRHGAINTRDVMDIDMKNMDVFIMDVFGQHQVSTRSAPVEGCHKVVLARPGSSMFHPQWDHGRWKTYGKPMESLWKPTKPKPSNWWPHSQRSHPKSQGSAPVWCKIRTRRAATACPFHLGMR